MKRKKKQQKALIGAVAVLVCLLGVNFGLGILNKQEENAEETEETVDFPVSLTQEDLAKVTVENENGTMTFVCEDGAWSYEEDENFPLDEEALSAKLNNLASITADRKLEAVEDVSEYGLDDPAIVVTVETADGESYTLDIGNPNESTGDYYVMADGEKDVYTIPSAMPDAMALDIYDVADDEDFPSLTTTDMTGIAIEGKEGTAEFVKKETDGTSTWKLISPDGTESSVDSTQMDSLLSSASSLSYSGYVDYTDENLADYGLDDPAGKITLTTLETEETEEETETEEVGETEAAESEEAAETEEAVTEGTDTEEAEETETEAETEAEKVTVIRTLLVGNQDEDGNYYVKLEGSAGVHTMTESVLSAFLTLDEMDYLDLYVNDIPKTALESLRVTYEGETKELTVESEEVAAAEEETEETENDSEAETAGLDTEETEETGNDSQEETAGTETEETVKDGEEETETESETETEIVYHYLVDGEEADETTFNTFYNSLTALKGQRRIAEDEADVSGTPQLTLNFTKTDGTEVTTEYYLGSDGLYTVLSSEALPAKVSKLDVEKVLDSYTELTEGETETETETQTES